MKWAIVTRTDLVRDEWLHLTRDTCRRQDGSIVENYYVIHGRDWVNITPITVGGELLLVREYRHGFGRVLLGLPGGLIDPADASSEAAARRELAEELGIEELLHLERISTMVVNPSTHTNMGHGYLALLASDQSERLRTFEPDIAIEVRDYLEIVEDVLTNRGLYSGYDAASLLRSLFWIVQTNQAGLEALRARARSLVANHLSWRESQ
jgi:ADP-ribose pyrophosphatase